jgi:hypothetical protein
MATRSELEYAIRRLIADYDAIEVWRSDPGLIDDDPPPSHFFVVITERRGYNQALIDSPTMPAGVHFMVCRRARLEAASDRSFGKIALRGAECVWRLGDSVTDSCSS